MHTPPGEGGQPEGIYKPVSFGFILLFGSFFTYQILGGTVTFLITGGEGESLAPNIQRLILMAGQIIFLALPVYGFAYIQQWRVRDLIPLRPADPVAIGMLSLAVLALQLPMQILVQVQDSFLRGVLPGQFLELWDDYSVVLDEAYSTLIFADSFPELLLVLTAAAATPALCEEFVFRGAVQSSFGRALSPWKTVLLTALFFAIFHLNPVTFIPLFMLGIVFGYATLKSGSIVPSIVAHFANNALAILILYTLGDSVAELGLKEAEAFELSLPLLFAGLMSLAAFAGFMHIFRSRLSPTD